MLQFYDSLARDISAIVVTNLQKYKLFFEPYSSFHGLYTVFSDLLAKFREEQRKFS